jgi:hypothetical protein
VTHRKLDPGLAQWAIQALARWIFTVGVGLGVLILVGGRARWSSPAYQDALRYPGAPTSWGWAVGLVGLVGISCSLRGQLRGVAVCLYLTSAWCGFFVISLVTTAIRIPIAGTTGIGVYTGVSVVAGVLAAVHWRSADR